VGRGTPQLQQLQQEGRVYRCCCWCAGVQRTCRRCIARIKWAVRSAAHVRPGEKGYATGVAIALLHVDTHIQGRVLRATLCCSASKTLLYQYMRHSAVSVYATRRTAVCCSQNSAVSVYATLCYISICKTLLYQYMQHSAVSVYATLCCSASNTLLHQYPLCLCCYIRKSARPLLLLLCLWRKKEGI
jgi:hypothetical protein